MSSLVSAANEFGSWPIPVRQPVLREGAVHLWRAELALPPSTLARLAATLTIDEQARADRLRFDQDRARFIASRGILRQILAGYTGHAPGHLRFHYQCRCGRPTCRTEHRKPVLTAASGGERIFFNLSHASLGDQGGLVLIALADRREVGVDLEPLDSRVAVADLAARILSPAERATWEALPSAMRERAFFDAWTCKEAYMKAKGVGLTAAFDQITITIGPTTTADGRRSIEDPGETGLWSLQSLWLGPRLSAALALAGQPSQPCLWSWSPDLIASRATTTIV